MTVMLPILLLAAGISCLVKRIRARRDRDQAATEAILRKVFDDRRRCLMEPTGEYDFVDTRGLRQIHGRTAPELAAEVRDQRKAWDRIERDLLCDADFRAIATRLNDQFPKT